MADDEEFLRVASPAEIPEGELRSYDLPGARIAVAHVENELFAFGDECTHEGCSLAEGRLGEREETVICPCHESEFDLRSGEPVGGPAVDPVPVYRLRLYDDWIEVLLTPEGGA